MTQQTQSTTYYNDELHVPRRSTATAQDVQARRTSTSTSTSAPSTDEDTNDDTALSVGVIGKSALRHRPLPHLYVIPLTDGTTMRVTEHELHELPEDFQEAAQVVTPQLPAPKTKRQPHPKLPVQDDTVYHMPPAKTDVRRTDALPQSKPLRFPRLHPLLWVGLAMLVMFFGWIALTALLGWWQVKQDDMRYGRPRTFQVDANVGHGTKQHPDSHFIALNLNQHIEVIEIQGDDPAKTKIYVGPTLLGQGQNLTPVTLSFADVNHDGKLDAILHIGNSQYIFLNTGIGFTPAPNQ